MTTAQHLAEVVPGFRARRGGRLAEEAWRGRALAEEHPVLEAHALRAAGERHRRADGRCGVDEPAAVPQRHAVPVRHVLAEAQLAGQVLEVPHRDLDELGAERAAFRVPEDVVRAPAVGARGHHLLLQKPNAASLGAVERARAADGRPEALERLAVKLCARVVLVALFDEDRVLAARHAGVALHPARRRHVVLALVGVHDLRELRDVAGMVGGDGGHERIRLKTC